MRTRDRSDSHSSCPRRCVSSPPPLAGEGREGAPLAQCLRLPPLRLSPASGGEGACAVLVAIDGETLYFLNPVKMTMKVEHMSKAGAKEAKEKTKSGSAKKSSPTGSFAP